jgi:spore coat protein U-like protein
MNGSIRFVTAALGVTCLTLAAGFWTPAFARQSPRTATLAVTAQVGNNCSITTTPLAFGAYDPVVANATAPLSGTGGVVITCTKNAVTHIGLGLGANALATARRMILGTEFLTYELYQDAGYATVWGTVGAAMLTPGAAPSKAARTFPVYGRVAAAQDVAAGSYTDSVIATVNF